MTILSRFAAVRLANPQSITISGATACPDAAGGAEVRTAWNGQLFAKQIMPFVDMTVKGWTWCECVSPVTAVMF